MNIIQKYTPEQVDIINHYTSIATLSCIVGAISCIILLICLVFELKDKKKHIVLSIIQKISIGIFAIMLCASLLGVVYSATIVKGVNPQVVTLTDIKDNITIDGDRLTIQQLPKGYKYTRKALEYDSTHNFRIDMDMYYTENPTYLVDREGNRYEVARDEIEQLRKEKSHDK